jgi:hypothetical protein
MWSTDRRSGKRDGKLIQRLEGLNEGNILNLDLLDTFGEMDIPSEDYVNINLRLYSETSLQNLPNVAKSSSSSHFIVDYDDSKQAINLFNMVSTLSKDLGKCFDLVVRNLVVYVLEVKIHTVPCQGEHIQSP